MFAAITSMEDISNTKGESPKPDGRAVPVRDADARNATILVSNINTQYNLWLETLC